MVQGAEAKMKGSAAETVKVVVRCRPMNEQETANGHKRVVDMDVDRGVVELRNIKSAETDPPKTFTFDAVYDWNSKQQELYDETFRPLIDSVLSGFNGTIFAYGQTGTGKTYTMEGIRDDPEQRGVIPNSFEHIFNHIARSSNQQYLIRASYLEIYQEEIRDLLGKDQKRRLELKERPDTGVFVKDLQQFVCKSVNEIQHVMTVGNQNRAVGSTNMNLHSSRSHAIFIITIECSDVDEKGKSRIRVGKLNLVDLAGSERQSKTGTVGDRLKEATKINLSLSALGNVISALVDGKSTHIPYRDSKLTRLLQDSLGGNSKTIMVANIGPASYNYDETITTLRYANRAKNIKNKPKINEDPKDAILREYQQELARLKAQLTQRGGKKKKKKKHEEGDVDEEEEEDEEGGVDEESILQQQEELDEERNRILNDQHMIGEEKQRFLTELKNKEAELTATKEVQEKLMSRIQTMESKLLSGGKNIIDHTNEQQRALQQRTQELMEQKKREREMLQLLEKEEDSSCEIASTFSSLQAEVEAKTRKLKKLFAKLQSVKQEMGDLHEEFCRDRVDLQHTQDVLTRELKLKALIIENFISPEEKRKILSRAFFDDDEDIWKLRPVVRQTGGTLKRPVSSASRRPTSEYAKMQASVDHNPRYKGENIMVVELDPAVRTTRDWEGPLVAPLVAAALEAALMPLDEDLSIDASLATLNRSQAVRSTRKEKTKGKLPPCANDEIGAVIKNYKQTMSTIIPEIQEWVAPPIAGAGQFHVPKVPRSGSQITRSVWTPRSSTVFEDDYDEDPRFFGSGIGETVGSDVGKMLPKRQVAKKVNDSHTESDDATRNSQVVESCIKKGYSCIQDEVSTPEKSRSGSVAQLVSIEESLHLSMDKGSCLILGPFGARRTCYHYRPQVKRCVTSLFRTPLRKVLSSTFCCVNKQQASCPNSSSTNLVCQKTQPDYKRWCLRKSSSSKRYCLGRTCHSHTSMKSHSKMLERNVPYRFSCLLRKKNIQWKASMHPCTYERILWRLPSSLWKQLELCLIHFEDDNALQFLTPVMYSLRRFSGFPGSRMVYSLSRDSYGVSERAWEDLVMALCLCCVLAFICRVYAGVCGCVTETLDWISW
ncbi:kinesin-like protein KIF3B isoform X2 [Homarus americanus]|uniref:Kinesin-like protein KIF3B-like n=1 Tax=Homarus americanus TaxID=6706 RepID=A0A8J5JD64_HOMAM|nr:kinesin-like protein KIF3B isoform X2 [Homarus americanus]KAG7155446.1 kinesin-like protein KIF3B-like [Homarus americanus]